MSDIKMTPGPEMGVESDSSSSGGGADITQPSPIQSTLLFKQSRPAGIVPVLPPTIPSAEWNALRSTKGPRAYPSLSATPKPPTSAAGTTTFGPFRNQVSPLALRPSHPIKDFSTARPFSLARNENPTLHSSATASLPLYDKYYDPPFEIGGFVLTPGEQAALVKQIELSKERQNNLSANSGNRNPKKSDVLGINMAAGADTSSSSQSNADTDTSAQSGPVLSDRAQRKQTEKLDLRAYLEKMVIVRPDYMPHIGTGSAKVAHPRPHSEGHLEVEPSTLPAAQVLTRLVPSQAEVGSSCQTTLGAEQKASNQAQKQISFVSSVDRRSPVMADVNSAKRLNFFDATVSKPQAPKLRAEAAPFVPRTPQLASGGIYPNIGPTSSVDPPHSHTTVPRNAPPAPERQSLVNITNVRPQSENVTGSRHYTPPHIAQSLFRYTPPHLRATPYSQNRQGQQSSSVRRRTSPAGQPKFSHSPQRSQFGLLSIPHVQPTTHGSQSFIEYQVNPQYDLQKLQFSTSNSVGEERHVHINQQAQRDLDLFNARKVQWSRENPTTTRIGVNTEGVIPEAVLRTLMPPSLRAAAAVAAEPAGNEFQMMAGGRPPQSARLRALTRQGIPGFPTASKAEFFPFTDMSEAFKPAEHGVLKISNIPYECKRDDVLHFVGRNAKLISSEMGEAVHIIMDRTTGKSLDCFVEMYSRADAQAAINKFIRARDLEGKWIKIGERHVEVSMGSQSELMAALFPKAKNVQWNGQMPVLVDHDNGLAGFKSFITGEELVMVTKFAEHPQRVSRQHRRPFTRSRRLLMSLSSGGSQTSAHPASLIA
jgi:hypothetical protein